MKRNIDLLNYAIICCILLFTLSCEEKITAPVETPDKLIKEISGYATSISMQVSKKIYSLISMLPQDATYRDGWWIFTVDTPDGRTVEVKLQFQDAAGHIQQLYDLKTTKSINANGQAIGSYDLMQYSVKFIGPGNSSYFQEEHFCFNASYNYKGTSAVISDNGWPCILGIPKLPDFYPNQGMMSVIIYLARGAKVIINYNGTRYASATYTYGGILNNFKIDLITGQIS